MRVLLALVLWLGFWSGGTAQAQSQGLQAGDSIAISVFQDPKLDRQMIIGPTGTISFPLVGQIKAAGMTPEALANLLKSRLRDKYTTDLDITVSLVSLGRENEELKPRFFVTGEVKTPGSFPIRTTTTVMQGISLAGGLSPFAAKQRIQIRRKINGTDAIFVFNYLTFEDGTDLTANIDLRQGDVIIVPERGLFE
jgi:polysaccharide export outer membrane protein